MNFLEDLEKRLDQNWDEISSALEEIRKSVISRKGCLVNMTADEGNLNHSTKFVAKFLDLLPSSTFTELDPLRSQLPPVNEAIVIPTQVQTISN